MIGECGIHMHDLRLKWPGVVSFQQGLPATLKMSLCAG